MSYLDNAKRDKVNYQPAISRWLVAGQQGEDLGVLMTLLSSMVAGRKALSVAVRVNTGCRSAVVHQEQSENHTQNRLKSSSNVEMRRQASYFQ